MTGTPHTHEAPDDLVYVHAAWLEYQLRKHLVEKHGVPRETLNVPREKLRLAHAEAHTQVLSPGDRLLIVDQELRDYGAALLSRLRERTAEIEHTVLDPGPGDDEITLTTLDNVEEWLSMQITRLRRGEEL